MAKQQFVFGFHAVKNLLDSKPELVRRLYLLDSRQDERIAEIFALAKKWHVSCQFMGRKKLDNLIGGDFQHQGVVAESNGLELLNENDLYQILEDKVGSILLLILDGVQDPHNLGACLRTANAMGVDAVIVPKDKSVSLNATVQKVSCGAALITPVISVTNLARTMKKIKSLGVWVVGMAAEAEQAISQIDLNGNIAIALGSEGSGLRHLTREHCDYLAKIDMYGTVESLNVSVTCGICLYEIRR